ncbi:substrate-binding domain-containing protein [Homoserinibacter gongjuensis]|uniref:Transcriptional regulator LacI/GalR-like sensor domain-containing protein n=1 Tax=Homoserinibacter gongjuensis TaxID=1162968 RepID=A0ABQ6JRK0_9MICO|nr:substrate-binding domain-containing protein [Homoserinibacter gongjuensis]GMA90927.1 hypothetical protein GCM10025869_14560 [Homoserinibacter gongjuensis]
MTPAELLEMNGRTTMPLVLLGEHDFDGRYDHVAIDNVQAAHDATSHLVSLGRTRIAAIGAQPDEEYSTPQQRTAGFESALADAGLAPVSIEAAAHYRRADGYQAARALLERDPRPDAIFCYSDLLAMGALRAVFDAGLRVPEDVAIIGIDDIEEGRYSRPHSAPSRSTRPSSPPAPSPASRPASTTRMPRPCSSWRRTPSSPARARSAADGRSLRRFRDAALRGAPQPARHAHPSGG